VDRLAVLGPPPPGLTPAGAMTEITASRDLYGDTPAHLAAYEPSKLRVTKGDVQPKDARTLLPAAAAAMLQNFHVCIERPALELELERRTKPMPRPYWDPKLSSSRSLRHQLFKELLGLKILTVRKRIKTTVGLFFVRKKDNNIRLIVDARRVNWAHRRPPHT